MAGAFDMYKPLSALEQTSLVSHKSRSACLYEHNPKEAIKKGFAVQPPKPKIEDNSFQLFRNTRNKKIEEVYSAALDAYAKGSYQLCLSYLSKVMFIDPDDKPEYYSLAGDAYLSIKDYSSAISNYKRVCILLPEKEDYPTKFARIYFQQGEEYFEGKEYAEALECYIKAAELKPDPEFHNKCIACLAALNRNEECLTFINNGLKVDPKNANLLILRAKLNILYSKSTLAYLDVQDALTIEPTNLDANKMYYDITSAAETYKENAEQSALNGKLDEAVYKISKAIATNPTVLSYHVIRARMHRQNSDFNASVDDIIDVMNKSNYNPDDVNFKEAQRQLLLVFNDFAVECFHKGFYEEAIVLLEKAIKGEKQNKSLYANRGDCFLKLHHLHFALLDYQQAYELDPLDKEVSLRLSIVYNELGILDYKAKKYEVAENYFSLAIYHNPVVTSYYISRARARYMLLRLIEAQVDIISALYLEKENKDISPMFVRLFPAKSPDEVLDDDFGRSVIEALESELNDFELNKETKKKKKKTKTFNKTPPLPNINTRGDVHTKMKKCIEEEDFHFDIIDEKKTMNGLVESVIHSKQDLTDYGPFVTHFVQKTTNRLPMFGPKIPSN